MRRDKAVSRHLRTAGWKVLRIWEHALKTQSARMRLASRIRNMLSVENR